MIGVVVLYALAAVGGLSLLGTLFVFALIICRSGKAADAPSVPAHEPRVLREARAILEQVRV